MEKFRSEEKTEGPVILHGRNPEELPIKLLGKLDDNEEVFAAYTGPDRGLTTVNLKQKHLSISDPDVDYIDILEQNDQEATGISLFFNHQVINYTFIF